MTNYERITMNDYKKAFEKAVEYIEDDCGCCPAAYDCSLEYEKCKPCVGMLFDNRNKDYNKSLSIQCWKEIFIKGV